MVETQEINVKINVRILKHPFFAFLDNDEKLDIYRAVKDGYAHSVIFYVDGVETFGAIIELFKNEVHVMVVGGKFPRHINELKRYCVALAKQANKKYITFGTERNAVSLIGEKLGFKKNLSGEYILNV